ncbi:MAG TPA: DoxX family protein [Marmoricola sp.]|jgi:putative oxidoreductase|nr:DoxX family protein [Marmoricola sp.]
MHHVDLGLLVLRLAIGPMLVTHGWNKVLGAGGLDGTTRWFASLGLKPAWLHARVAAATEIGAGLLVTAGLATGLAATGFVGLMVVAALTDHRGKGYFIFKGGSEYVLLVAGVALALAALGPGRWSLDHALDWNVAGTAWFVVAAVGGIGSALLLLASSYRPKAAE